MEVLILLGVLVVLAVAFGISVVLVKVFGSMLFGLYDYWLGWRYQRRARRRLLEEFREAFGFDFFCGIPDIHVRLRLESLARSFHEASEAQGVMKSLNDPLPYDVWSNVHQVVSDALDARKAAFWRAHGLAKKSGFEVLERHTDYLPEFAIQVAA